MTSSLNEQKKAWDLGVVAWMTKPVSPDDFSQLFDRLGDRGQHDDVLIVEDDAPTRSLVLQSLGQPRPHRAHRRGWPQRGRCHRRSAPAGRGARPDAPAHRRVRRAVSTCARNPTARACPVVIYTAKDLTPEERAQLTGGTIDLITKGGVSSLNAMVECIRRAVARGSNPPGPNEEAAKAES